MEYTIAAPGDRAYEGTLTELYEVLRLYMEGEVRRVVLFNGKPGTGKSTLALNLADALSKRTLILSHKTLEWTSLDDWVYILEMFQPEMLIIDDIDRLGSMLQKKLYLFEEKSCNVPLVVLTSNHKDWLPDAFKRPGRIDQIIDMETPSSDIRREVVKKIAMMEGVEIPEDRLDILDRIHRRYSGAYMVELFRRVKIEGWTYNIPSYDQTFNELHEALRTEWNQGPRKTEAPSPDDLSLDTFSD
jgi:SpoVK/Ycf46/Vps4 family AAA+-type ATPase